MMVKSNTGNCQFIPVGLFILYQPLTQNSMKSGEKPEVEEIRVGTTPNYALGH